MKRGDLVEIEGREDTRHMKPVERIELQISQDRDQFTDMMGGGSYYEDAGWSNENEDPNCIVTQFNSIEEAMKHGQSTINELNETDDPHMPFYRALVFRIGPRGKRTFVRELK